MLKQQQRKPQLLLLCLGFFNCGQYKILTLCQLRLRFFCYCQSYDVMMNHWQVHINRRTLVVLKILHMPQAKKMPDVSYGKGSSTAASTKNRRTSPTAAGTKMAGRQLCYRFFSCRQFIKLRHCRHCTIPLARFNLRHITSQKRRGTQMLVLHGSFSTFFL